MINLEQFKKEVEESKYKRNLIDIIKEEGMLLTVFAKSGKGEEFVEPLEELLREFDSFSLSDAEQKKKEIIEDVRTIRSEISLPFDRGVGWIEWKKVYVNEEPHMQDEWQYALLIIQNRTKLAGYKYTIMCQKAMEGNNMFSYTSDSGLYILFEKEYLNVDKNNYEEIGEKDLYDHGTFVRAFRNLEEAERYAGDRYDLAYQKVGGCVLSGMKSM